MHHYQRMAIVVAIILLIGIFMKFSIEAQPPHDDALRVFTQCEDGVVCYGFPFESRGLSCLKDAELVQKYCP